MSLLEHQVVVRLEGGELVSGQTLGWFMSFLNTSHLMVFEWS